MTTPPKSPRSPTRWLVENWHLLLLGAAALMMARCYLPTYCLATLNSDMIIPAILYRDIVTHGGHASDWYMGGASFLFPDLAANFFLHSVLGDGIRSLQAVSALFFLGLIVALILGYSVSGFPHLDVFVALAVLIVSGIAWLGLPSFFHSVEHDGSRLVTLFTVVLLQRAWLRGSRNPPLLIAIALLSFLGCASDGLVLVILVAPAVATMALCACRFRNRLGRAWSLALVVGVAGDLGYSLGGAIYPPHLATGVYIKVDATSIENSLRAIRHVFSFADNGLVAWLAAADILVLIGTAAYLARQLTRSSFQAESPAGFFLLSYTFFLIAINWAAAVLSGNYHGTDSTRYIVLSLVWPLFLAAGWLSAALPWRGWPPRILAVVVTAVCLALALHPPVPTDYLTQKRVLEPGLASLMKRENTPIAIGDYWCANFTTELSNGATPVLELSTHGQASYWTTNPGWYENLPASGVRLVLMEHQLPGFIRAHFGEPERMEKIGQMDVWIYRPEDAIHYIPTFGTIGNRQSFPDADTFRLTAPGFHGYTGVVVGDSIVARSERDLITTLEDGPKFRPIPGRYRAEFTYAFLSAPKKGHEPVFESSLIVGGHFRSLGRQPLTYAGPGVQKAVEEFSISPNGRGLLLCQLNYEGSGTIRVDQEEIRRIGD